MYKHVSSEKPCDRRLRSSTKLLSLVCVIGLLCSSFSGLSFVHV